LRVAQEFVAVSPKIGLRKWLLIVAAGLAAASLFISLRGFLLNGDRSPGSFEGSLALIGLILIGWDSDAYPNPTTAKWLSIAAIVVSVLVLGMLVALPSGDPVVRLLLAAVAVIIFGTAVWKMRRA
jgi:hypothetical protein